MADWISSTLTFGEQVEDLVGVAVTKNDALNQYLTDGAREVVSRIIAIRPEKAMQFADNKVTAAATGMPVADVSTEILSVTLGLGTTLWEDVKPSAGEDSTDYEWNGIDSNWVATNYPCDRIDHNEANEAYNSQSLKYRTLYNAGWFMRNGMINTTPTPSGGTSMNVTFVEYPIVQHTFTPETVTVYEDGIETTKGLEKFPIQYAHLIAKYAAMRVIRNLVSAKTIPAVPTAPDAVTISYSAASLGDAIGVAVDPQADVLHGYTGEDVSAAPSDGTASTASDYTKPSLEGSGADLTDVETGTFGTTSVDYRTWWDTLSKIIENEEDSELAQVQLGKINSYISAFNAEVSSASANMQATIQDAQLSTQASIANASNDASIKAASVTSKTSAATAKMTAATNAAVAKMTQSTGAAIQKMTQSTNLNITNAAKTLEAAMGDFQMKMGRFSAEIQNYGNSVTKVSTEYQWLQEQYSVIAQEYNGYFIAMTTPEQSVKTAIMDEQKVAQARPSAKVI